MTSQEIEKLNELANIALDAEVKFRLLSASLKGSNVIVSKTYLSQAHNICHQLEKELGTT